MGPQVGSGLTYLWLTLCEKIKNTLRNPLTAPKDPAPQEAPPEDQAAVAQESLKQSREAIVAAPEFHRFSELPTELRLQIWEEATRYKRYVVLDPPFNSLGACVGFLWGEFWHREFSEYAGRRKPLWTSPTPPPALLSVSWEARQTALKVWRPSFACEAFPAAVYINFDQDDVVIGSGALANADYFGVSGSIDDTLRPWGGYVAATMIGAWLLTPDVEKIQRIVACGKFMKGLRFNEAKDFMTGLKSLTTVRIGNLTEHCDGGHFGCSPVRRKTYTRTSRLGKGAPLLSLGGIDFAKTTGTFQRATTRSFAELEVFDFDGGRASEDVQTCWNLGPETSGWEPKRDCLIRVYMWPGKRCVRRSKWRCETRKNTSIWYAI